MIKEKKQSNIFVSYSHEDTEWAREFVSTLKKSGVTTWFDSHDIKPGEKWRDVIQDALRRSSTLVVVITKNSAASPWTFFEIGAAVADNKEIIPVLAEDLDMNQIPLFIRNFQILRAESASDAGKRVAEAIEGGSTEEGPSK